jgi:uncharacterized protein (TIGR03083 family)
MDVTAVASVELDGLDPFALLEAEAASITTFLTGLDADGWSAPTGCAAWDRHHLVAHLLAVDDYFLAGLDDGIAELFGRLAAAGAHDLDSFNAAGVAEHAGEGDAALLAAWQASSTEVVRRWRDHGDGDMQTSVGAYPARWQAFHAAAEWATHADDLGVPVDDEESAARTAWRARVARFALAEAKDDLTVTGDGGRTRVEGRGVDVVVDDPDLVDAVSGRLADDAPVDADVRALLSSMP